MKASTITKAMLALVFACVLAACVKASSLTLEPLTEASGVRITAENAGADQAASSTGAIIVTDGDVIIVSPCLDKGSFHLTMTEADGTVIFDDKVSGRVMFQTGAVPGTYDVIVSGEGATGWMTVFATQADEITKEDVSLAEALADAGVDPSLLSSEE